MSTCKTCKYYGAADHRMCGECYSYQNYEFAATALNVQEGGQHYKSKAIQPIVYIHANNLGFCAGNVVKYITRYKEKNGAEDIRKAIHYCQLLLELEYSEKD